MQIIRSMLDQDLYKLTQQKAVLRHYRGVPTTYVFHNRRPEGKFDHDFVHDLYRQLDRMSELALTDAERDWLLSHCPWLGEEYVAYLQQYRFRPSEVHATAEDGELSLRIEGPWERTILWEVPLMAAISELFFLLRDKDWSFSTVDQIGKAVAKGDQLHAVRFADFGTRRRRSYDTQKLVVGALRNYLNFFGTSNVHLAMLHGTRPVGTMAHEWVMGVSAMEGLRHANRHALRRWAEVFDGDLGIALPDTYGSAAFFADFDGYLARLFDGVRHDSGDPVAFMEKTVAHYRKLGVEPATKMIVFSDSLTADSAVEIARQCEGKIRCAFGIGTHFTNDFESKPLNMVIKLARCNNVPVVKLSDTPSKAVGDTDALRVAQWTFLGKPLDDAG